MPVSKFSSGASAVRSESRSRMIARWNTTRERISQDERRMSENGICEVDGTGLHDRPDWPLSSTPASPASVELRHEWKEGDHHITKVDSDWVVEHEHEVSDVEDDEEMEERIEEQQAQQDDIQVDKQDSGAISTDSEHRTPTTRARANPTSESRDGSFERYDEAAQDNGRVSPVQGTFLADVTPRSSSIDSDISIEPQLTQLNGHTEAPRANDNGPHIFRNESLAERDEQLDDTPPMPSGLFQHNPEYSQPLPRTRQPSYPNGTADISQHGRQSSLAKTAIPGYHSRQGSYNPYNTTQIPYNKERVRYSWQSIQDDAPNRPRIHIIKLVSNTTSASSAFPQGEAFGFSISPSGRRIAAYDSSRLYILQTAALPVGISQDFSLKRRPLAVELNDSGSLVAILADEHTVNVYDLSDSKLRRNNTFKLDFPARCIAVAPCGGLIAAGYEGGIEIFSLASSALPTDRRAMRTTKMDRLAFSEDGSTLLGTTTRIHASSTVVVNVPMFPAAPNNIPTAEELKLAWCSELLHPENISNSSHATFMREDHNPCNDRVFAWNGFADSFGILDTNDVEYGNIDFPVVIQPPLSTCGGLGAAIHSCPAIDEFGDTVAMIVNDRTIRLYVIPHKVEDHETTIEAHSIDHELDDGYGSPFHDLRWVHSHSALPAPPNNHARVKGRLIVTSPGGVVGPEQQEDSFEEVEGGRIILFDFDAQFAGQPGQTFVLNLGKSRPQPLEEEEYDVADAVALVRKRTVRQNKTESMHQKSVSLGRTATSASASRNRPGSTATLSRRTASVLSVGSSIHSEATHSLPDLAESVEAVDAFEEPFSNTAPRSQASLQRAASNVQRHRFQALEERTQESVSIDNSNGNFLALPEYTEEPNAPLPSRFRAMAGLDASNTAAARATELTGGGVANRAQASAPATSAANVNANTVAANDSLSSQSRRVSMPRGLLRAYSNAASPGVQQLSQQTSKNRTGSRLNSFAEEDDAEPAHSTYPRTYDHRFSTPLASLMEQPVNGPRRSSSSRRPGEFPYDAPRGYNMSAFRQAAATASLFPQTQSSDHVPLPHRQQTIGAVAHPVTSWRPPAVSVLSQPLPSSSNGHARSAHSRKSSLASKQAFASTAKARRLGFFKRGRSSKAENDAGEELMDDSKTVSTWRTGNEKKCIVM